MGTGEDRAQSESRPSQNLESTCNTVQCQCIADHLFIHVSHKAVAEVSKIGNLWEMFVVVNHRWESESTDEPKGGWSRVLGVVAMVAVVTSPATTGCSVV